MTIIDVLAHFRPGGGDSYSGGGGHGGGDSGGGGGGGAAVIVELILRLIQLCIYYPKIGIPLLAIVVGLLIYAAYKKNKNKDWDSGPPVQLEKAVSLDQIRSVDPDFSPILFEDFVFRLYATCQESRHRDDLLAELAPYVSDTAQKQLAARQPRAPVSGIVIGAMRPYFVTSGDPTIVGLELETNYTVQGTGHTTYAIERWKLSRAAGVTTKPRDRSKGWPCPNCGAPWKADVTQGTQKCSYCGEVVDNGRFDWLVTDVQLVHSKEQPPSLTEDVPERGTDLATYRALDVDARWNQLVADDPSLNQQTLLARLNLIYTQLYAAWEQNNLEPARMYLSDGLFDYLTYWTAAYARQGLRNHMQGMHITRTDLAKITRDKWYDAITIRIWGTGKDYVVRATGEHVRGSTSRDRPYSEYWTLIRSAARRGPTNPNPTCSNCGAPAKVAMTGACEFCGAHVTGGEFDWVLSKIEQDDSYRG